MSTFTGAGRLSSAALLAAAAAGPAAGGEIGYYSQPALHGDRLVFVSEGDLWTAQIPAADEPIPAWRLTSGDGAESRPVFSPDGAWIAFTGEYDGNTDVYVMPADGGAPRRLTFHPEPETAITWTPDGRAVLFRSGRSHPHGRAELWRVAAAGGMPQRYDLGQCTMAALSSTGRRIAFTPWSNESWTWKRYRGGTAPEIWIGDLAAGDYRQLTDDPANDQFPMWLLGQIWFLSDRTGTANLFSCKPDGSNLQQRTGFARRAGDPTAIEGYDVRWPSADAQRRGRAVVFCQAAALARLDAVDGTLRRLDVRLASDRVAARRRFAEPMETVTAYTLAPDGKTLLVESRGELITYPVKPGPARQLTHTSAAREWGASYLDADRLVLITDAAGEQQIALAPADGSSLPSLITEDREAWLFPPIAAPDAESIAFADKSQRLHVIAMETLNRRQVDASEAWEITDYRFSPDGRWLAYVKPVTSGYGMIFLHALRTGRSFAVSDGLHDDFEPRWDPAGRYLYFLSRRNLNPVVGDLDLEHVYIKTTQVYAVALAAETPPPIPAVARSVGVDLEAWAAPPEPGEPDAEEPEPLRRQPIAIDTDGLTERQFLLPIEAGNLSGLEAMWGGVAWLSEPTGGLLDGDRRRAGLGEGRKTLHRYDFLAEEAAVIAESVSGYAVSADRSTLAWPVADGFRVRAVAGDGEPEKIELDALRLRVDVAQEWRQIFQEAWRLQRDFYWAPNYAGAEWPAMKTKYAALLPRVGTRGELNDVIGEMIGELGTSHTYIWGGDVYDEIEPVSVGMLGADIELDGGAFRITRILPRLPWETEAVSPLAAPYLGVSTGDVILAIDGLPLGPRDNLYDLLQDRAGKLVRVTVAADAAGTGRREIEVRAIGSERPLRYAAWVQDNARRVEEASGGRVGYLHIPDMGGRGLVEFSRRFYPQIRKRALIVDVRDNGGGWVSQMIIRRLDREVWAFMKPRHGVTERYPRKSLSGHLAVLIDQHAGSDGDIFPESFRLRGLGPLIGTRTWGGVVGIRADKPFVDMGLSSQPEFAWWEPKRGWSLENSGVSPDIEVPITPADRTAGRDPQLEEAVKYLLERLERDPMEPPEPPPWPR